MERHDKDAASIILRRSMNCMLTVEGPYRGVSTSIYALPEYGVLAAKRNA
jgi:hypothetical protein